MEKKPAPGWWKEIATTQLGGSGAAAGPHKGASRGARDTRPIGATGAREVPPGGCIEGVWSSGPTGFPPYVASARVARPTPGGQRGARAWPEKPKGNERKRKRWVGAFFKGLSGKCKYALVLGVFSFSSPLASAVRLIHHLAGAAAGARVAVAALWLNKQPTALQAHRPMVPI